MRKAKSRGAQSKSRAQTALPTIGTRLGARRNFASIRLLELLGSETVATVS